MPKISVIVPNYNHQRYLSLRITSILNQTFQDFEIIILDDCSVDNSKDIIEKFRSNTKVTSIVYNDQNSGSTFPQWKKGIALAKGEYIWIAESDDYSEPSFLEVLIKPFDIYTDLVISYCRSYDVDENNSILGLNLHADALDNKRWNKDYVTFGKTELTNYLKYRNTIPNASAVVFKKPKDIEKVLKSNMRFCGDWLFWKNLLSKNGRIAYSHLPLNYFRNHTLSTRFLTSDTTVAKEVKRFDEYKTFVPKLFFNPFDDRYRWMMEEWIHREPLFRKTNYYYFPILHPSIAIRYYLNIIKMNFIKIFGKEL